MVKKKTPMQNQAIERFRKMQNISEQEMMELETQLDKEIYQLSKMFVQLKLIGYSKAEIIEFAPYLRGNIADRALWVKYRSYRDVTTDVEYINYAIQANVSPKEIATQPEKFSKENLKLLMRLQNIS